MSDHITDDLPLLLNGEADRETVHAAATHLRECADCQHELVAAVVAHASLTSARRFAAELVVPPAESTSRPTTPLPDLAPLFAEAQEEARERAEQPDGRRPRSTSRRRAVVGLAAAAAVLVGGGVVVAEQGSDAPATRKVALNAFQQGTVPATATIRGDKVTIDASKLRRLDRHHVYEVWMTDRARTDMWPAGLIGTDNRAQLTINTKIMARYTDFEVSVQPTDEARYSGVSVLRGSYR